LYTFSFSLLYIIYNNTKITNKSKKPLGIIK